MNTATTQAIAFEVKESRECLDDWIVGAVDYASEGEMYIAVFSGFAAEERALEYAAWKNSQEQPTSWRLDFDRHAEATISSTQVCSSGE